MMIHAGLQSLTQVTRPAFQTFHQRQSRKSKIYSGDGLDESLEGMAQELLKKNPDAMAKLRRIGAAARRVAELQAEQARIEDDMDAARKSTAASTRLQEAEALQKVAEAEEKAAELLLRAAELEAEDAEAASRLLSLKVGEDEERIESGKAGAIAAIGGGLAMLPLLVSGAPSIAPPVLELLTAAISAFLFGVTYRYAVRKDVTNVQLRGGVVAAFGLVRGLAEAGGSDNLGLASLAMGESMILFTFAATALEAAFRQDFVRARD